MDETSETIENFEALLKQQNTTGCIRLYNDKTAQNTAGRTTNQKLNPQSIISNLAKQMKAIQNSENLKIFKKPPAHMEKYKTSSFLPVNMLQEHKKHVHPPDPHKFDTQLISNTQLINIVECAEVLDVNVGMTQEFETTFFNEDDDAGDQQNENPIQKNTSFPILDISLKEPDPNLILSPQILEYNKNNNNVTQSANSPELQIDTDTQIDNCTQILDQCIVIEDIDKIDNSHQQEIFISLNDQSYTEEPLSPVFNVKNKKTVDNTPGLVYDLEEFENFEKIAMPVIELTEDKEEAKFLINSQIVGKELVLQTCFEDVERISPVIEICNPIKVDRDLISNSNKDKILSCKDTEDKTETKLNKMDNTSPNECFFKDEILFSSDEEDEYKNQLYKDLPFTCALETSFYEDVAVLNKTMYVGFQTASNKSIQIHTESFSKAKNLLDIVEQDLKNEATLTELVELCESNKLTVEEMSPHKIANVEKIVSSKISRVYESNEKVGDNMDKVENACVNSEKPSYISMEVDLIELNCQGNASSSSSNEKPDPLLSTDKEIYIKSDLRTNKSVSFEGFKTASYKPIHLSEKAIEKSKHILQNLDLDENLQFKVEVRGKVDKVENIFSRKEADQASVSSEEHNIDDDVIREFQEEIMHTELEDIIKIDDNNDTKKEKLSEECQRHDKPENVRFRTASNKNIKISDAALAKSKTIFQDIDFNNESETNNIVIERPNILVEDLNIPPKNTNFKTASNKEIVISDKALAKTSHVFNDFDMNDIITHNKKENQACDMNKPESNVSHPPRTESGEGKCTNIKHCPIKEITTPSQLTITNDFKGLINPCTFNKVEICVFRTASNKKFTVSDEALSKSKKIFNKIAIEDGVSDTDVEPPFYGFELNDEFMSLIEDTLEKSQKIFEKLTDSKNEKADVSNQQYNKLKDSRANCLKEETSCSFNSGFKTASNKDVKISDKALAKSRKIFQDISEDSPFDVNNVPSVCKNDVDNVIKFQGFHTASNKPVKISEAALAKSRKLFKDINDHVPIEASNEFTENDTCTTFKGFQTASNKQVKISEEALAKSRNILFQDIDQLKDFKEYKPETTSDFKGFQTASNKEVNISEDALTRSRKLFQDISEIAEMNSEKFNKNTGSSFKGFQTASNKKVKISDAALAKSRKIFEDICDGKCISENEQETKTLNIIDSSFKGFLTASNKKVKISAEALAKSKDDTTVLINNKKENTTKLNTGKPFMGFQTANKKPVQISEQALAKSRKIFEDINHENSTDNGSQKAHTNLTKATSFKEFQTASNKEVTISEEALAKSRKIFQDIDKEKATEINVQKQHVVKTPSSTFIGFQTASNKQVNVSEEALARSRKIFEDLNDKKLLENISKEEHTYVTKSAAFKGFQTASNKDVKISEEALVRSRKIFEDFDETKTNTNELDRISDSNIKFKGFQTANNKTVAISEEAIAKSRKLFQDINLCPESDKKSCSKKAPMTDATLKSKDEELLENNAITSKKISSENINRQIKKPKPKIELKVEQKFSENFEDIDTQMLNNFDVSMREVTPKKSKRSGSPILSCPKSKKRKVFQIPYSQKSPKKSSEFQFNPPAVQKPENIHNFNTTYKKTKLYYLKDLQRIENATKAEENIDPYIQEFNFENILQFKFTGSRNDINNSALTISDLKDLFLNSVHKKLVPDGWLDIQLKLIIWKLISYELKFPKTMHLTCTANNVIEQLKFRYDKELYNAERPALRKIFEKDDTSTKMLILCVAAIYPTPDASQPPEILLTDGWYMIKAVIDKMLAKFVGNGKITVGTKLVTHGAELVGSEQAVSPWEDTSSFRLKIFGNSTRRARWDARLGYHGNGAILSQLSNVALDGGKISQLRVFVSRVYPPLYVDKFDDGSTVTRSERLENVYQMKFENERQALLEKIYEDVEKEVLDQDSQDSDVLSESGSKRRNLDSGSQIAKKMKNSRDPAEFRSHLTSTQTALLEDHTTKERERLIQTIQNRVQEKIAALGVTLTRNVVTLLKVKVAGVTERRDGGVEVTRALLSIWRPNEAVIEIIRENSWIEILNVVPTAMRYSELQISAGRQSVFSLSKYKESEKIKPFTASLKRTCYLIKYLVRNPAMTTDYNEIDTVGIIFEIDPPVSNFNVNKHQFQNVYLTDLDKNIISVNFWGGLKKFGFENVLDTGQIVACTNLQKRAGNSRKNIPQYRVTEFSYFTKTPKSEFGRKIIEELHQKLSKIDKKKFYEECVTLKTNYSKKQHTSENVTPYRFPNFDIDSSKNRVFIDSPLAQNSNMKDENLNLSGLDFESTFKQDTQDLSPKTLLRKRQVKEKIAKLKRYGEPPPLSPIQMINKSKNAAKAYKSPFSKSDVSPSVAICSKNLPNREDFSSRVAICDKNLPNQSPSVAICNKNLPNREENSKTTDVDIQCSPVITLNRTYVKRSNPVKLNFSKNENSLNEAVDEFAEDFDCSPPLSLD